jgi:hypothetical protein
LNLAYASQAEGALDRAWRKQRKIEGRLADGGAGRLGKPKGMHWATFERLREQYEAVCIERERLFVAGAARVLGLK